MIGSHFKMAWDLLERAERKQAGVLLLSVLFAALASTGMVASIIPFLTVLSDPGSIQTDPFLAWVYGLFGFESTVSFVLFIGSTSFVIILLASLAQIMRAYAISMFATMRVHSIGSRLLATYLHQPYEFFLNEHSGELGAKILSESQVIVDNFYRPISEIFAASVTTVFILVLVIWNHPSLSLGSVMVLVMIYGAAFIFTRKRLKMLADRRILANKERFKIANESLGGIKAIKVLGKENRYISQFKKPSEQVAHSQAITIIVSEVPNYVLQGLAFGGVIALGLVILLVGGDNIEQATSQIIPTVGLFAFAGQRMIPEMQRIYANLTLMHMGNLAVSDVHRDLVQTKTTEFNDTDNKRKITLERDLSLSGISYRYPNSETKGLTDISLNIKAGEKIGIVGTTGAGKTTLADLLLGLITAHRGEFVVDGTKISRDNVRDWQRSIGYVPQDIFLSDGSIFENIALGVPRDEIDMDRVKEVCRIASIHDFIQSDLPETYNTHVGEQGVRLSGGQRQRIGIARALYTDPSFVVFDEATSALDNTTESEVMSAIEAISQTSTVILIAHRLTSVKSCDRIVVMNKGEISSVGVWESLKENDPIFQSLVAQM